MTPGRAVAWGLALSAVAAPSARAAQGRGAACEAVRGTTGSWTSPLTRHVSFHSPEISLREGLDGLAAASRIRLSYSSDVLPLDRRVCLSLDSVPVGDALAGLLHGFAVEPVVLSEDHVVLAPRAEPIVTLPRSPVMLERVVVTGSAAGAARRSLPVALDVLDGRDLSARSVGSLAEGLNAAVPGLWLWTQSPLSLRAEYGSIRGAASFGMSYPKVYIDGIQVANPLLVTHLVPEAIERVEVIRGPQGAALYGADALSGVTNIVTRHETADAGSPRARLHGRFGVSSSDYSADPTVGQTHLLALRLGSNLRSAGVTAEVGSVGAFVPGGYARYLAVSGNARRVARGSIVTGTVRFFGQRAGNVTSPLLAAVYRDSLGSTPSSTAPDPQRVAAYTVGASAKFLPNDRWQHSVVAGLDGYDLSGLRDDRAPIPDPDPTAALRNGAAARGTLRASSVLHLMAGELSTADVTFAVEHSTLWERPDDAPVPGSRMGPSGSSMGTTVLPRWRGNTGAVTQLAMGLFDRAFVSGGIRVERDEGADGAARFASLPALGAVWIVGSAGVTLKLRAAYGKGLRWPETPAREALWHDVSRRRGRALEPEAQSGIEGGVDVMVGRTLTLQLTRFDQTASGLIQRVTILGDTTVAMRPGFRPIGYELQNVGEIDNDGWEAQGTLRHRSLSLTATAALVDSRVRSLAPGYSGDMQVGDRMLEVPERTASVTAAWSTGAGTFAITAYRAADWVNYDRVALARDLSGTAHVTRDFIGSRLRTYWRPYAGNTHVRATATVGLSRNLTLALMGDNLLDRQTGEPDNATVVPGRTVSLGVRSTF